MHTENTALDHDPDSEKCLELLTQELLSKAVSAYETKDYSLAISIALKFPNDQMASCFLGMSYLDEPSLESMRSEGWKLLLASGEAGFEYAWLALGNRYLSMELNTINLQQASYWFLKGAEVGCSYSQYSLAWCYCKLEKFFEASKWLFVAVGLGNKEAAGLCESIQVKMEPDEYKAAREFAKNWLNQRQLVTH